MTENKYVSVDVDEKESPECKRARYDSSSWTLTKNELVLHSVYDSGVGHLDIDAETDFSYKPSETKFSEKLNQISLLKASLPENTLNNLSLIEVENILNGQNCNELSGINVNINYFDFLSDEVILHIFKKLTKTQLNNVALVCRRFSQLVEDESLWNHMDVSHRILDPGSLGTIISRQVIVLRLARSQIMHPPILPNVKAYSREYSARLMYLDLTMATISPQSLESIFNKCQRLKKLSLESVPVNDKVLIALSKNVNLEVINFAMSLGIKIGGLKNLLTNCRNIKELNFSWTYLNAESITYICENLPPTLTRFNFSGCRKLLFDENMSSLVANCPNLTELDLSDCTLITGEAVRRITALHCLNFLALSRCYNVSLSTLLYLKKIPSLTYLDVHGTYIDAEELEAIKEGLGPAVNINKFKFSSVARPTVGLKKNSIWGMRVRD